jgi:hypothetical protein
VHCFSFLFACLKQVKALQIVVFYKMVDHNISIGETNKLKGSFNYQAWKIKAKTIYKRENLWEVIFTKVNTTTFPFIVNRAQIIES